MGSCCRVVVGPDIHKMLRVAPVLLLCLCLTIGEPQNNFNRNRNNRRPARQNNNNRGQFLRNGVTRNGSRDRREPRSILVVTERSVFQRPASALKDKIRLVTERAPEESPTGSPGTVTRPLCPTQDGTGSPPETTAERGAWI